MCDMQPMGEQLHRHWEPEVLSAAVAVCGNPKHARHPTRRCPIHPVRPWIPVVWVPRQSGSRPSGVVRASCGLPLLALLLAHAGHGAIQYLFGPAVHDHRGPNHLPQRLTITLAVRASSERHLRHEWLPLVLAAAGGCAPHTP